ncbi:G-type lectin S-receptor-like serine/threonine-protein kinase SD2-5 [Nymphaea colorata]|uniref:Receptor-like serine/threonine-protein kinase n=1 Tax=Nymphaea colorata TaxID=210225 RepID=A0A5K0ZE64_9MAGN|nr:G-type lectin S-receptor-like serine/threonine-protein kinase SD2-5 [Nymphaea colorata]
MGCVDGRGFVTVVGAIWVVMILLAGNGNGSIVRNGSITPPFSGSEINWVDNNGMFLRSVNGAFAFGFFAIGNETQFLLSVWHIFSQRVVWIANRDSPVQQMDTIVFSENGNLHLELVGKSIWSTETAGKGVTAMMLQDSGNLVLTNNESQILWQSFEHPVDTLLSDQPFRVGMELVSSVGTNDMISVANYSTGIYNLKITSDDMILLANYSPPQQYWSMRKESRFITNNAGSIYSAKLVGNSWIVYDQKENLLQQFVFSQESDRNITWAAVLGNDGSISFYKLPASSSDAPVQQQQRIPDKYCDTPQPCQPYYICTSAKTCQCPNVLDAGAGCQPAIPPSCSLKISFKVIQGVGYFANSFSLPVSASTLAACQDSCQRNCSCIAFFFDDKSSSCFQYSQLGSLKGDESYSAYLKVSAENGGGSGPGTRTGKNKRTIIIVIVIAVFTLSVIGALVYAAFKYHKRTTLPEPVMENSEDDDFFDGLSGMPIRYSYKDLQTATNNFSVKLGQGGFGSVYQGILPDGSRIAVKKLEGIGQGKKEFRAEVNIIGSIHHVHLVRLRGFCAEGTHRLLAYEFMAKGSLDRWIFPSDKEGLSLDWEKRYNIAIGTAKGLAYLHEDCNAKIVHCDIKPENVLLDDNFVAKVSDFGLAKLMTREQSLVCTTLRGTRGYLAPEWITNYAISEKSDVYSYGIVLLEIIGGRKIFDPAEGTEKAHFPSYAFKKMEEGKLKDILDTRLHYDDEDDRVLTAVRVALWCIQEDMSLRPSMAKVIQMLEGLIEVPQPPIATAFGFRLYSNFLKATSGEASSSNPSDCNSEALLSAVRLSGPR